MGYFGGRREEVAENAEGWGIDQVKKALCHIVCVIFCFDTLYLTPHEFFSGSKIDGSNPIADGAHGWRESIVDVNGGMWEKAAFVGGSCAIG